MSCRCGWGGEGHLGRSPGALGTHGTVVQSFASWARTQYHSETRGYTNPNARCPVCQADVFFYQSPDGGRVFFDELGPPWPRHPCTDAQGVGTPTRTSERSAASSAGALVGLTRYVWQDDEWAPFIWDGFAVVPPGACAAISGLFVDVHLVLFVTEKNFIVRAPYQLKRRDDATFLLSTVQYQAGSFKVFKVVAFRHLRDALAEGRPRQQTRAVPPSQPSKPRRAMPRSMQPPPSQSRPDPLDSRPKTALQLAFERAKGARSGDA